MLERLIRTSACVLCRLGTSLAWLRPTLQVATALLLCFVALCNSGQHTRSHKPQLPLPLARRKQSRASFLHPGELQPLCGAGVAAAGGAGIALVLMASCRISHAMLQRLCARLGRFPEVSYNSSALPQVVSALQGGAQRYSHWACYSQKPKHWAQGRPPETSAKPMRPPLLY